MNVLTWLKKIIDDELRADSLKAARELPKPVEIKKGT